MHINDIVLKHQVLKISQDHASAVRQKLLHHALGPVHQAVLQLCVRAYGFDHLRGHAENATPACIALFLAQCSRSW